MSKIHVYTLYQETEKPRNRETEKPRNRETNTYYEKWLRGETITIPQSLSQPIEPLSCLHICKQQGDRTQHIATFLMETNTQPTKNTNNDVQLEPMPLDFAKYVNDYHHNPTIHQQFIEEQQHNQGTIDAYGYHENPQPQNIHLFHHYLQWLYRYEYTQQIKPS